MRIRTLIVDDEPLARERIRTLLEREDDIEVVGECTNGEEAVFAVGSLRPDLLFLDVQMPEMDGFGVVKALGADAVPAIVFVTAYSEFALRAFDAHALDYLLKPFDPSRLQTALQRARAQLRSRDAGGIDPRIRALLESLPAHSRYLQRVVIRTGPRLTLLRTADIDWMEADGNYVRLHSGKKQHLLRETMNSLEAKLDPERFMRIHRSTIVNVERIREFESLFQGEYLVVLEDGTKLTSSRGYRDKLNQLLESPA